VTEKDVVYVAVDENWKPVPVRPLHASVHLRTSWRVYEQLDLEAPAGFLIAYPKV
jgi:hypothetical protein